MDFRLKLIQKLLVLTIFSVFLGLSGFVYFNLKETIDEYKKSFEEKVFLEEERLSVSINEIIKLGVSFGQLRGFDKECRAAVSTLEYAKYCFIMDLDGKVYYHNLPEEMGKVYVDSITQNSLKAKSRLVQFYKDDSGKRLFDFTLPLFDPVKDEKIGVIRIEVSAEIVDKKVNLLKMRALLFGIPAILIASGIVMVLFYLSILKPIKVLINGVIALGQGNLDSRIELKTNDEFSSIADAFNNMASSLKRSMVSIEILRQSEKRFEDIAHNTGECIWEVDAQGRYTYISPVVEKTLGFKPQEIIGKYFYDLFLPDEREELKKAIFKAFSKKENLKDFLNQNIRKDGQTIVLETSAVPIIDKNGSLAGYRGINRDITERKNKEEELRQNYEMQNIMDKLLNFSLKETTFSEFLDYVLELLFSIKWLPFLSKGAIFFIESTPEVLVMRAQKDLFESIQKECALIPFGKCICGRAAVTKKIEFVESINELHEVKVKGMLPHGHYCVPIIFNDKVIGVINLYVKEGSVRSQKAEGFLLTVADVLATIYMRKITQEELTKAYEQLKLTQAQLVQSAKMSSLGVLAGGVAHEINNPLTGVLNNVQLINLMAESKKDFNLADFKELLTVIEESALRCVKIVKALLGFSHASDETKQNTSLNEIIRNVFGLIEHEMNLQNISIEQQLAPDLPLIVLDSQLMQQVILDIISNAKWAIVNNPSIDKGIITIKTEYDSKNKSIVIYIQDTGIGIAKENLERIFEPFFTTKSVGEGTGLGLSIVYTIIKEHKGNIEVESEVNKGTIFKIILPVA